MAVHLWRVALLEPAVTSSAAGCRSLEGGRKAALRATSTPPQLLVLKWVCATGSWVGLYLLVSTFPRSKRLLLFFLYGNYSLISSLFGLPLDPHPDDIIQRTKGLTWFVWPGCSHVLLVSLSAAPVLQKQNAQLSIARVKLLDVTAPEWFRPSLVLRQVPLVKVPQQPLRKCQCDFCLFRDIVNAPWENYVFQRTVVMSPLQTSWFRESSLWSEQRELDPDLQRRLCFLFVCLFAWF